MTSHRIAMISGANRGIGAAVAKKLYSEGYCLSLGLRDPHKQGWWGMPHDSKRILLCEYDASSMSAGKSWVDQTVRHYNGLHALVNNAGIMRSVSLEDEDENSYADLWNINVMAPLRVIRAALPHLRNTQNGRIVNMASLAGKRVRGNQVGYAMTKHALVALTHSIRKAGWEFGIRATAICPGLVATDMASSFSELTSAEMTQPEDIARVVSMILNMPNNATVAEMLINCRLEDTC